MRAHRPVTLNGGIWTEDLRFPYYNGLSIVNTARSLMHQLGLSDAAPDGPALDPAVWGADGPPPPVRRVVLYLSDGLGYLRLRRWIDRDPEIRDLVGVLSQGRGVVPLTSVMPSTTTVALPTYWTGQPPGVHGVFGTVQHLPALDSVGSLLFDRDVLRPRGPRLTQRGFQPESLLAVPTLAERMADVGGQVHVVQWADYIGTGLSRIMQRGPYVAHGHTKDISLWQKLREALTAAAEHDAPAYLYVYNAQVDAKSHEHGAESLVVLEELRAQLRALVALAADPLMQDGSTLLLVTADHGHADIQQRLKLHQFHLKRLSKALPLRTFTGDMRLAYLRLRHGSRKWVESLLARHYAESLAWLDGRSALAASLYGAPEHLVPQAADHVGDLLLLPRQGITLEDKYQHVKLKSTHTGLSEEEMWVPLLHARL